MPSTSYGCGAANGCFSCRDKCVRHNYPGEASLTRPATLEILGEREVLLTITEGRYHQVKRMFAAVGNRVLRLHRQQIGAIRLDIEQGRWRHLTTDEVAGFK